MDQLSRLRFDMWTDGKGRDMCALDWRTHEYDLPYEEGKRIPGLKSMWLVMTRQELEEVSAGTRAAIVDGYHHAEIWGDQWLFYNMETPSGETGDMRCPFRKVNIPRLFVKALLRIARRVWAMQTANQPAGQEPRIEWDIPLRHRRHVCKLYGQGKGSVVWEGSDAGLAVVGRNHADPSFAQGLETIQRIALNSTRGFHQRAKVNVYGDPSGIDWCAIAPHGRRIMNGGLINHGAREGKSDWSVHT